MTSVTAHEIFCYFPPLYVEVGSFACLNAKIEKITTGDKFENYGFFAKYYTSLLYVPYISIILYASFQRIKTPNAIKGSNGFPLI